MPPAHYFFIFMQFSEKIGQIIGWNQQCYKSAVDVTRGALSAHDPSTCYPSSSICTRSIHMLPVELYLHMIHPHVTRGALSAHDPSTGYPSSSIWTRSIHMLPIELYLHTIHPHVSRGALSAHDPSTCYPWSSICTRSITRSVTRT